MILDSIRAQVIRDGIEDVQYLTEVRRHANGSGDGEAWELMERVERIDERFVRFGPAVELPPEELQAFRKRMAGFLATTEE